MIYDDCNSKQKYSRLVIILTKFNSGAEKSLECAYKLKRNDSYEKASIKTKVWYRVDRWTKKRPKIGTDNIVVKQKPKLSHICVGLAENGRGTIREQDVVKSFEETRPFFFYGLDR